MTKSKLWTPVRKGKKYCAPGCGRGCTWDEYQAALKRAQHVVNKLGTKGWKIDIWDNLGWHSSVVKGEMNVHIHIQYARSGRPRTISYSASFKITNGHSLCCNDKDPVVAVKTCLRELREHIRAMELGALGVIRGQGFHEIADGYRLQG